MKKYLAVILVSFLLFSCKKDGCPIAESTRTATAEEIADIEAFLGDTVEAIQHTSGLFYTIIQPGSGTAPELCSYITVKYTGKLTNGTVFDSNTTGATFLLGQLIYGWQKGLPLIKPGGKITLYIPPSLGYGSSTVGSIPANSILVFEIELLAVQN